MKPKPFSPLNHLTVPCAMKYLLASRGRTSRLSTAVERQTLPTPTQNSRERSTDHDTRLATAPQVCHIFLGSWSEALLLDAFVGVGRGSQRPSSVRPTSIDGDGHQR